MRWCICGSVSIVARRPFFFYFGLQLQDVQRLKTFKNPLTHIFSSARGLSEGHSPCSVMPVSFFCFAHHWLSSMMFCSKIKASSFFFFLVTKHLELNCHGQSFQTILSDGSLNTPGKFITLKVAPEKKKVPGSFPTGQTCTKASKRHAHVEVVKSANSEPNVWQDFHYMKTPTVRNVDMSSRH